MQRAFFSYGLAACVWFLMAPAGYTQMIVAHRGASFDAPENTCAAVEEAWRQNADGIEADFHISADRQLVCIHDKDTLRTAGQKLMVANSRLEDLKRLEYGAWKASKFKGEPLPTFAEVAACIPVDKKFVIELKTGPEIVPLLVEQLPLTQLKPEQLLIIAFNSDTVAKCKELLPSIRVHWLVGYKQNKSTGAWSPSLDTIADTLAQCGADGLGTQGEASVVTPEFIDELKRRGLSEFHVWTVDDPQQARYFQKLGAIGITTNRPAFIRNALQ
jgi:glycerophosphoryl diester phosphodiesterase